MAIKMFPSSPRYLPRPFYAAQLASRFLPQPMFHAAVAAVAVDADAATIAAKVNELIASLKAAGVIA